MKMENKIRMRLTYLAEAIEMTSKHLDYLYKLEDNVPRAKKDIKNWEHMINE